ncbi:hypothetical protein PENTCL1PPCAC_23234, partial [Pristionchus entomophagus]
MLRSDQPIIHMHCPMILLGEILSITSIEDGQCVLQVNVPDRGMISLETFDEQLMVSPSVSTHPQTPCVSSTHDNIRSLPLRIHILHSVELMRDRASERSSLVAHSWLLRLGTCGRRGISDFTDSLGFRSNCCRSLLRDGTRLSHFRRHRELNHSIVSLDESMRDQ